MLIEPYCLDELAFAWCYRVSYRWRTKRAGSQPALANLDKHTLDAMMRAYEIHVLEANADDTDVLMLASLQPNEAVAACAGKTKGRVSVWLREQLQLAEPQKLLSRSYFACTTGKSTTDAVEAYLSKQSEHHGYAERVAPPVFVQRYPLSAADELRLSPRHAVTLLHFHLVLSTPLRRGIFGQREGEALAERWRQLQDEQHFALEKLAFVPDHVHLAVRVHPMVSPASLVLALMNAAQETAWAEFAELWP